VSPAAVALWAGGTYEFRIIGGRGVVSAALQLAKTTAKHNQDGPHESGCLHDKFAASLFPCRQHPPRRKTPPERLGKIARRAK
jgi:hypothetical protein